MRSDEPSLMVKVAYGIKVQDAIKHIDRVAQDPCVSLERIRDTLEGLRQRIDLHIETVEKEKEA